MKRFYILISLLFVSSVESVHARLSHWPRLDCRPHRRDVESVNAQLNSLQLEIRTLQKEIEELELRREGYDYNSDFMKKDHSSLKKALVEIQAAREVIYNIIQRDADLDRLLEVLKRSDYSLSGLSLSKQLQELAGQNVGPSLSRQLLELAKAVNVLEHTDKDLRKQQSSILSGWLDKTKPVSLALFGHMDQVVQELEFEIRESSQRSLDAQNKVDQFQQTIKSKKDQILERESKLPSLQQLKVQHQKELSECEDHNAFAEMDLPT